MRKSFEECKELFLQARNVQNFNDMAVWSTELLKYDENLAWVWANRGESLAGMGFHLDAILNYDRAISLQDSEEQLAILYSNKGAAYWDLYSAEKAIPLLEKAINTHPMAQTYQTLGNVYKHQGYLQRAIQCYRNATATNPEYADSHLCLGIALLRAGNLQEGWKEFEWRWKSNQLVPRGLKAPQWNGEDLSGKTILVYGEQGLGDIIQFSRYAGILAKRFPSAKVIVEGRPPVNRLLSSIKNVYAVLNAGEKLPALDYAIPMVTLGGMMTPTMGSIPPSTHEFTLKHHDVQCWADKFKQLPEGFRVGVCWAGMSRISQPTAAAIDVLRSTELSAFAPVAAVRDVIWVSLQKGPPAEQIRTPPAGMRIADFTEDMYDFYETACAIQNCDLVISVDTAVAHVAASIGKPTWILSRWDGCWRWFGNREDSPWYPSVRQYVQPKPHDWAGLMNTVAQKLQVAVDNKKQAALDLTVAK